MVTTKIGCIGAGYWGKNLVRNFNDLGALASICEVDAGMRAQLAGQYPSVKLVRSTDEILNDTSVQGVAIATPAETHGRLVRESLLAGKDVFVEKPLCLSLDEGEELIKLAAEKSRILMVGHLLWYHPAIIKLQSLIESGELGRIQYIYSNRLNLGKIRQEENILWSFAPHDVSVVLGLLGEMPDGVKAQGGNYLHDRIADVTVSLLSFPSGVKAHIFVSWLHPFKEQKLIIVGDRRMAVFDDVEKQHKLLLYPHAISWKNNMPIANKADAQSIPFDSGEPLRNECQHFLDCMITRQRPRTDGREGLRVLSVLQQCQDALENTAERVQQRPEVISAKRSYKAHDSAFIDEQVEIGEGTTIWHVSHILKNSKVGKNCRIGQNVVVGPNVSIGNSVKIQNNVSVYEGVTLEDDVFCGPSMVFTNVHNPRSAINRMNELRPTLVRQGATLGANCTIVCGITIGRHAFIGAGSVVLADVPDFALMVGNPGKIIGWMCACGHRIRFEKSDGSGACEQCAAGYWKEGNVLTTVQQDLTRGQHLNAQARSQSELR